MNTNKYKYPKDWIQANMFIKKISRSVLQIKNRTLRDTDKSLNIAKIVSYCKFVVSMLDVDIKKSSNTKDRSNLYAAKKVIIDWINKNEQ